MIAPDRYSFRELLRQYRRCRNKRVTRSALAFEADAAANLLDLQRELREHTWSPGTSICFVTDGPKPREVFAADFRDRIVHHLLVSRLEPTFEPGFIHDSFTCRKGKGTLAGSDRLMAMYVDDLCLLSTDPAELLRWRAEIEGFLRERLKLSLRAEVAEPRPVGRRVDWIGWRPWWDRRLPRRRYVEMRGRQRLLAERVLGLRTAWLARGGFGFVAGFPASLLGGFRARAASRHLRGRGPWRG